LDEISPDYKKTAYYLDKIDTYLQKEKARQEKISKKERLRQEEQARRKREREELVSKEKKRQEQEKPEIQPELPSLEQEQKGVLGTIDNWHKKFRDIFW